MTKTPRTAKIAKRVADAATPEIARYILWDSELPGFGLRVETTGRKTFVARYRAGGGRTGILRQATIGQYGPLTVDEARTRARKLLGAAAGGNDPLGERKKARQAGLTVAEVCDWYLADAASGRLLGRRGRPIKASTVAMDRSRIETHVKPLLGRQRVSTLSQHELEVMQADIVAGKTAKAEPPKQDAPRRPRGGTPRGGRGVAARTLGMMRTIFEHARRRGLINSNPAAGARKIAGQTKAAHLNIDQVRALGKALRAAEGKETPTALAAIRVMALTGFRRLEVLGLRPHWMVGNGGVDFPDTKSGPQVRPIGSAAIDAINTQAASGGNDDWIFPAERGTGHFVGLPKVLARIGEQARIPGLTAHVLRHTFASVAAELGYSELAIAGLLGHGVTSVTGRYVHLDAVLVAAADRVAAVIRSELDGRSSAEVIPLSTALRS